jgi:hypothetical protein
MDEKTLKKMRQEYPSMKDTSLEKIYLYERMMNDEATFIELVRLEYLWDMISAEQYADFEELDKAYPEDN